MLVARCPLYSLGSQKHVFPGVELRGVRVLPAQVLCRRLGWELRFTDVPEVPSQVNGFTCEQDRGTSAPYQHQCERELELGTSVASHSWGSVLVGLGPFPVSVATQELSPPSSLAAEMPLSFLISSVRQLFCVGQMSQCQL